MYNTIIQYVYTLYCAHYQKSSFHSSLAIVMLFPLLNQSPTRNEITMTSLDDSVLPSLGTLLSA